MTLPKFPSIDENDMPSVDDFIEIEEWRKLMAMEFEKRFEEIYDRMSKEQDRRLEKGENGFFPYWFMEIIINDLEKEVLEAVKCLISRKDQGLTYIDMTI